MNRFLFNRRFRLSAGLVVVSLLALLSFAWYFRVWSWNDFQVYQMMSRECHPVWKDLHWGRVHAGQDVEDVIATTKPVRVERHGDFVELRYPGVDGKLHFSGVAIMAKNGRLASADAWSCTGKRVFFNELTREDLQAYNAAYEAHWQPIRKKREAEEKEAAPDPGGM